MNYYEQSRKQNPFDGLTLEEQKKLFVYFCQFATPRLNDEQIFRKYGFVLPMCGLRIDESMSIGIEVARELAYGSDDKGMPKEQPSTAASSGNTGCLVPLMIMLGSIASFCIMICCVISR